MQGKKLSLFIEALYINPEMEFEYAGKKDLLSDKIFDGVLEPYSVDVF